MQKKYTTKFRKFLFVLAAIITTSVIQASAQNEYFITNKNDTVKCTFIPFIGFNQYIFKYKLTEGGEVNRVSSDTITEYRQKNTIYAKRQLSDFPKPQFVQWLIKGKLNVYARVTPSAYVNNVDYYAAKSTDSVIVQIKTNNEFSGTRAKRKSAFEALIADAPEVAKMFDEADSYTVNSLMKTIRNYNLYYAAGDVFFVNKRNDTTRCKIIFGKDSLLLYKKPLIDGLQPLNTDSLNAYKLNGILYYRQQLPEIATPQFIMHVIKGKLDGYLDLKGNLYLSKAGSQLAKVKGEKENSTHKEAFFQLISDKPEVVKEFKSKRYNDDNVIDMIVLYNKDK
jgi:hypothetical protein